MDLAKSTLQEPGWVRDSGRKAKDSSRPYPFLEMLAVIAQLLARIKRFQSTFLTWRDDPFRPLLRKYFWTGSCSQAEGVALLGRSEQNNH